MFVDERAIIVQSLPPPPSSLPFFFFLREFFSRAPLYYLNAWNRLRWVLWSQRARSGSTRYLQISRWQFGADSSVILEFIALRVKACGDGPFVL